MFGIVNEMIAVAARQPRWDAPPSWYRRPADAELDSERTLAERRGGRERRLRQDGPE